MQGVRVLCALAALHVCAARRELLIRDFPGQSKSVCNNTFGGRWYLADDQGRVCHRDVLDYTTGCCDKGLLHSCETCEQEDQCCSCYAHCISCCMGPGKEADRRLKEVPRGLTKTETGFWSTPFEYCQSVCRTSSRSTQHENAFILDRKYCFSKRGRPHLPMPPLPSLPANITEVIGEPGQSCSDACRAANKACAAAYLVSVNDCNALRDRFPCEAGCSRASVQQQEFPGYVMPGAPKWQWPALCVALATPALAQPHYNCTTSQNHVRRVCTCEEAPALPEPPPSSGGGPGGGAPQQGTAGSAGGGTAESGTVAAAADAVAAAAADAADSAAQPGGGDGSLQEGGSGQGMGDMSGTQQAASLQAAKAAGGAASAQQSTGT